MPRYLETIQKSEVAAEDAVVDRIMLSSRKPMLNIKCLQKEDATGFERSFWALVASASDIF